MKIYALLFALTISPSMAHENLEVDSMLSILAKPKLAMQIESPPVDAIRG
ncbi:MAG TPA: hypothetical protein VGJ90_12885 [Methylophilaceae bacterium]|jgi:hypothetical protein